MASDTQIRSDRVARSGRPSLPSLALLAYARRHLLRWLPGGPSPSSAPESPARRSWVRATSGLTLAPVRKALSRSENGAFTGKEHTGHNGPLSVTLPQRAH